MDERAYIQEKQASWQRLSDAVEQVRKRGAGSLSREQLSSLGADYRAVVADLAFARSQAASEQLVTYLNGLAGRAHGALYTRRTTTALKKIAPFIFAEFPALFRSTLRYSIVAMLVFFIGWGAAAYVIREQPDILGPLLPEKMSQTDSGGEIPFSNVNAAEMSSFIMTNNIKVGIIAFAGGVTAGVYTAFELFKNGFVIGAIATIGASVMGPTRFWSLILPHGIIELAAIFICGGAGLMIGSTIIAPGNLRRADALKTAAARALRLFAGAVLLFVVAAIIEGFITPSPIPVWSKLVFAGVTALALTLYLGFAGRSKADRGS